MYVSMYSGNLINRLKIVAVMNILLFFVRPIIKLLRSIHSQYALKIFITIINLFADIVYIIFHTLLYVRN